MHFCSGSQETDIEMNATDLCATDLLEDISGKKILTWEWESGTRKERKPFFSKGEISSKFTQGNSRESVDHMWILLLSEVREQKCLYLISVYVSILV